MHRRRLMQLAAASAFGSIAPISYAAHAQDQSTPSADMSPETMTGIPPIRWNLLSIDTEDDSLIPADPTKFTVQFLDGGNVFVGLDCNGGGGSYEIDGDSLSITNLIQTLMFCGDDSIDQEFSAALLEVNGFAINSDASDQLALILDGDGAQILFSAALTGVVWQWEQFEGGDGSTITPDAPERYTIELLDDGSLLAQVDCNSGKGTATVDGNEIDLIVATTRMACNEG